MDDSHELIQTLFGPKGRLAESIPGYESRPAQNRMAELVVDAVVAERSLVVEAATGTGKTYAYLLPLLFMKQQLIVSTATKALQGQIFEKDVPLLRRVLGVNFSATTLKGRGNYLCRHRFRVFRLQGMMVSKYESKWPEVVEQWVHETHSGDRDELDELPDYLSFWKDISCGGDHCTGRKCGDFEECFLNKAREKAKKTDLVVVNHHLFFADLAVREGGFGEILPNHEIVVFDEAHRIPDVVTTFFGWEISNHKLRELASDIRRESKEIGADDPVLILALPALEEAANRLRQAFPSENRRDGLTPYDMQGEPGRALVHAEGTLHNLLGVLEPHRDRSAGLASCGRRVEEMLRTSGWIRTLDDPGRVYWYETRDKGIFLTASPLETGPTLQELLYPRLKTAIFTSATLATGVGVEGFSFLLDQLGLDVAKTVSERLPAVFDYANRTSLYLPNQLPEPNNPMFPQAITEEILSLLEISSGRALCLFTSLRMLNSVYEGLKGRINYPLLVQGQASKGALLDSFREQTSSVLLGMASFWEGVDIPGESLSMVIVDRLPFVTPADPLVAARGRWLESNRRNAFMELHMPRAILSLKQGLGRLLRRSTDRGVMVVLDVRLTKKRYGKQFLQVLPPSPIVQNREAVRRFFACP